MTFYFVEFLWDLTTKHGQRERKRQQLIKKTLHRIFLKYTSTFEPHQGIVEDKLLMLLTDVYDNINENEINDYCVSTCKDKAALANMVFEIHKEDKDFSSINTYCLFYNSQEN